LKSLYVHVPFCESKCPYCAFASAVKAPGDEEKYLDALAAEALARSGQYANGEAISTLYIGGGTPTALSAPAWRRLISLIRDAFRLASDAEVTAEANPGSLSPEHIEIWRGFINRVSLGIQSFNDRELGFLGRIHDSRQAVEAAEMCLGAGFKTSLDLMFGLPDQTMRDWAASLRRAVELSPNHISIYQLTVEPGTPFADLDLTKKAALPDGYGPYRYTEWLLPRKGYAQYEVASFSKQGEESRHNLNYWADGEYLGLGPAAWSNIGGERSKNAPELAEYARMAAQGKSASVYAERLAPEPAARQAAVLALRTKNGIEWHPFEERHGKTLKDEISEKLSRFPKSMVINDGISARLTAAGLRVANRIWEDII
jgi:oxygen-independent coproporphyrinogen-3 oxidase